MHRERLPGRAPCRDSDTLQVMFASVRKSPERLRVIERVVEWTRERFRLPKEAVSSTQDTERAFTSTTRMPSIVKYQTVCQVRIAFLPT